MSSPELDRDMKFVGVDGPEAGSWDGLADIAAGWSGFLGFYWERRRALAELGLAAGSE